MRKVDYSDILGSGTSATATPPKSQGGKQTGRKVDYSDILGPIPETKGSAPRSDYYMGMTEAQVTKRMEQAYGYMGKSGFDPFKSLESAMALADIAAVGVPTFGEKKLSYEGRAELVERLKKAKYMGPEIEAWAEETFGPQSRDHVRRLNEELGKPYRDRYLGIAVPEALPFQEALRQIPQLIRGVGYGLARQIPAAITGNPEKENWRANLEEIEGLSTEIGATRAADGATRLLQYFIPVIGQFTAASDSFDVLDRAGDIGLPAAMKEEILGTLQGVNVFEPGLDWDERLVRGLGLALAGVGVAHGAGRAKAFWSEVKGGKPSDPFGFGKVMAEAMEATFREDANLAAWIEGKDTVGARKLRNNPEAAVAAVDAVAAGSRNKIKEAAETAAAQGGDVAAFWTRVMERQGEELDRGILDIAKEEATRPEWAHLDQAELKDNPVDIDAPVKKLKETNESIVKKYNRSRNQLIEGMEQKLEAGGEAIWRNGDVDNPVKLKGFAGEKDGARYWYVEGSDTAIPEVELIVAEPKLAGKNVKPEDVELAKVRGNDFGPTPGADANAPGFPRNGFELMKLLASRFGMGDKTARAISEFYEARATAWAERTGNTVEDWFNDRIAGFGDADTIFRHEDLNKQVKFADEDGVTQEGRILELDGDRATVKVGNQPEVVINRADIVEGLTKDQGDIPRLEPEGTRTPGGATVIRLNTYGTDEVYFELTGKAQQEYLEAEAEYKTRVRQSQNQQMGGAQRTRAAGMEFARRKREITGELTAKEYQEKARKEETAGAGKTVITPDGPGTSLGVNYGRIRVDLGEGRIESYPRADIEVPTVAGPTRADSGVKRLNEADLRGRRLEGDPLGQQLVGRGVKGFTDFVENGRAIIRAFSAADASTFLHELAHVMRREMYLGTEFSKAEVKMIEDWAGVKDGQWHEAAEEKFARAFERYVMENKAPTRGLQKPFARMKAWMRKVYSKIEGSALDVDISPQVRALFDKMMGKDIDTAKVKRERLENMAAKAESDLIEARRQELLNIDPDDPRLGLDDPFDDRVDDGLINEIRNTLGGGPEDTRSLAAIIEGAREAEYQAEIMEQMRREGGDTTDAGNIITYINEFVNGPQSKSGRGNLWIATINKNKQIAIDERRPVKVYSLADLPEFVVEGINNFIKNYYNGPDYYLITKLDIANIKRGDKPKNLLKAEEIMLQNEGSGAQVVTRDLLKQYLRHLKDANEESTRGPSRLYQKDDAEDAKNGGMSEAAFNQSVDDMTFWAAEILGELDGNLDELKKLIRKEFGTDGMQTLEITRRINELIPIERIVETHQRFGGSYKAIVQMLIEEFPELPKSRHGQAIERALRLNGERVATVPKIRTDKTTKRKEPEPFKEVMVIGGEDIMVPANVFDGVTTWASHLPFAPNRYNEGRFWESVAGRGHAILDYLVKNRQEAVTNLTEHMQSYTERLKETYGKLLNDKEARKLVMFVAEGKGDHTVADGFKVWKPVIDAVIEQMLSNGNHHATLKKAAQDAGIDWGSVVRNRVDSTYAKMAELVEVPEVRAAMTEAMTGVRGNPRLAKHLEKALGGRDIDVWLDALKQETGRKPFELSDLQTIRPDDWEDIVRIAEWHRAEYDVLYADVNAVRVRFGLGEIPYRKDYMTHMAEEGNAFARLVGLDGIDPSGNKFARPNSVFNRFAMERIGERSKYDSLANFEAYADVTLRQIHLTEPAVRHRAVSRIIQRKDLERQWQDVSNYVDNAANELVNKGMFGDVDAKAILGDARAGQQIDGAISWLVGRFARNTIVGNLQSALMQTAQLPIAAGMVGVENVAAAAKTRVALARAGVDISQASPFLTRRYGYDGKIAVDWFEQTNRYLAKPMEFIEEHTARTIWTAAHIQATKAGKEGSAAIEYADKMAERMIGGRAIGEKSPIFNTKWGQFLLQFQYEVSNFNQMLVHDLPYTEIEGRNLTRKEMMGRAAVMAVSIYAMNHVYEFMFGRRPLPDVIETTADVLGLIVNPNTGLTDKAKKVAGRITGEFASATAGGSVAAGFLPETGAILGSGMTKRELFGDSEFGQFSGGAPISSGIQRMTSSESFGEFAWDVTTTLGLPGGGAQLRKTVDGIRASSQGGVYDKQGNMRFKVRGADMFRASIFGTYATGEGQSWLEARREKAKKRE